MQLGVAAALPACVLKSKVKSPTLICLLQAKFINLNLTLATDPNCSFLLVLVSK